MAVDFAGPALERAYGGREADASWRDWCRVHLAPGGKDVADIGCGGGIYARGFASLGARTVIGIDRSPQYVAEAQAGAANTPNLRFAEGEAAATGLADSSIDLLFCRAVIHHLSNEEKVAAAQEWFRILRPGGLCVVQDRTLEDVTDADPAYWVRTALFETFPRLLAFEETRRPGTAPYSARLRAAGFSAPEVLRYPEIRRTYSAFAELEAEILSRKGKSILHELSDHELADYVAALAQKEKEPPLIERDSWTVWLARKP